MVTDIGGFWGDNLGIRKEKIDLVGFGFLRRIIDHIT